MSLLCLIFIIFGLSWIKETRGVHLHVLLDQSASMSSIARQVAEEILNRVNQSMGDEDRVAFYSFGRETVPVHSLQKQAVFDAGAFFLDRSATNIEEAIHVALERTDPNANSRLLLLSDGIETQGKAEDAAIRAKTVNVPIDVVSLHVPPEGEVAVERLSVPDSLVAGEPYTVHAIIAATEPTEASVTLYRDGQMVGHHDVHLDAGRNTVVFRDLVQPSESVIGSATFEVRVDAELDGVTQNNVGYAAVQRRDSSRVYVVAADSASGESLGHILEEHGLSVTVRTVHEAPLNLATLVDYEAVVFVDVSASTLSSRQMTDLMTYVERVGGGLLAIGGSRSFGLGNYGDTPLNEILPVAVDAPQDLIMPSLAMVLVLDRSGSMAERSGQFTRLDLAKEAALGVLDIMHERDLFGVIAFDSTPQWAVPIQPVKNRVAIASAIASLAPEGGTSIGPALERAGEALAAEEAAVKHLILLSDGYSTRAEFERITKELRGSDITVSTVGTGQDFDRELLADIAHWGSGRAYYAEDARSIPQIFATETVVISRSIRRDEIFQPQWDQAADFWLDNAPLPQLGGYIVTTAKAAAAVHLRSPEGHPILATWRRGLGRTAAFTSNPTGSWAEDWAHWEGYGSFMGQLVRWLMKPDEADGLMPRLSLENDQGVVTVDALDLQGRYLNFLQLGAEVIGPDGTVRSLTLDQVGPGRYTTRFPATSQGPYTVLIRETDTTSVPPVVVGGVVPYPQEYRILRPDTGLLYRLADISGGEAIDPSAALDPSQLASLFTHPAPIRHSTPLAPWLFAAAFLLFFTDILVRYLPIHRITASAKAALVRLGVFKGDEQDANAEHTTQLSPKQMEEQLRLRKEELAEEERRPHSSGRSQTSEIADTLAAHSAGRYLARRRRSGEDPSAGEKTGSEDPRNSS